MDGVLRDATKNVVKIADARKRGVPELPDLSPTNLCHLVKALDPGIVKALEPQG